MKSKSESESTESDDDQLIMDYSDMHTISGSEFVGRRMRRVVESESTLFLSCIVEHLTVLHVREMAPMFLSISLAVIRDRYI